MKTNNDVEKSIGVYKESSMIITLFMVAAKGARSFLNCAKAEDAKEKGNECMKKNKPIEAMLHYTQALKIDPNNPTYYSNRSLAFLKVEQYYFALIDAEEVIRRMPHWVKGYFRKGEVQMATEHYEEAIQSYKKGLEMDPDDAALQNALSKAIDLNKKQKSKERRLPWLGGIFGLITSLMLIAADESVATNKAILESDIAKLIVIITISIAAAGLGYTYRMFLQKERCSLFEPPTDLFGDENIPDNGEKKTS
ncbi:hypothetical protein LSH36_300g05069 [Paralvinella palmiformis]|uniref:Uncharacterized protein n=1 Tax=Paralvinella palmiformis TaxID=53620 RepID=A0AAD9N3W8_9ANNE|nr:hypothetical protein LSH36_300g05069 [Paralvinella palmiformis]